MRKLIIILLSLTTIGCGDITMLDEMSLLYMEVQTCVGKSGSMPNIVKVSEADWTAGDDHYGEYYHVAQTILLREKTLTDDITKHEMIHHLLFLNDADPDSCHSSRYFEKCASSAPKELCQ